MRKSESEPANTMYQFTGLLASLNNSLSYKCIYIPDDIIEKLKHTSRTRVNITFNGHPFNLAIQNQKSGERYVTVSNAVRKQAGIRQGEPVVVCLTRADAEELLLPEELEVVLEQDEQARSIWESFTIGRRRSLAHYVTSVKNTDSRIKRALELVAKAKRGELFVQKNSDK